MYRPDLPDTQAQRVPERDASWHLVLSAAELHIGEVVYASKLIWVFGPFFAFPTFWEKYVAAEGPLAIRVFAAARAGASFGFDLREFTVVLEDGRSLSPIAAAPWGRRILEPPGPVMLSDGQTWRGRLQYDLFLSNLTPFTLQLGTLDANGEAVRLAPIPFTPGKSYSGS